VPGEYPETTVVFVMLETAFAERVAAIDIPTRLEPLWICIYAVVADVLLIEMLAVI
jgi:hypothetical protein